MHTTLLIEVQLRKKSAAACMPFPITSARPGMKEDFGSIPALLHDSLHIASLKPMQCPRRYEILQDFAYDLAIIGWDFTLIYIKHLIGRAAHPVICGKTILGADAMQKAIDASNP